MTAKLHDDEIRVYLDGNAPSSESWPQYVKRPIPIKAIRVVFPFQVHTLEGTMTGKAGDYLVEGIKGERYPCDREVFEESYERVP